jgi:hypothetical protein
MLSKASLTYSEMLEALAIPSSHLTYHLENLGELVIKSEDGKYKLSSFGRASVSMMQGAEDVPDPHGGVKFSAFPLHWKGFFAALMIGIIILASLSYVQFASFNNMSNQFDALKIDYANIKAQNEQLLSWSPSTSQAMTIIKDVIQIDVSKYQATLESSKAEVRSDLGNVVEEVSKYSFVNTVSRIEVTLRFRNNHFSMFTLSETEGYPNFPPVYTTPQPADAVQAVNGLIQRYQSVVNDSYLEEMHQLLTTGNVSNGQVLGNTKINISGFGESSNVLLQYTINGSDFAAKSIHVTIQNHIITEFTDDYFLYKIGSAQVTVTKDQAIQIAKNATEDYKWTAEGSQVSNFTVLDNPVTAEFYPYPRSDPLTLFPYWYITLHLDKTYPGGVNVIAVGVWADTGELANIQALGGQTTS